MLVSAGAASAAAVAAPVAIGAKAPSSAKALHMADMLNGDIVILRRADAQGRAKVSASRARRLLLRRKYSCVRVRSSELVFVSTFRGSDVTMKKFEAS